MKKLWISGGRPLAGSVPVQGAKNSVLPLLAAALVCRGVCVLENCPALRDVDGTIRILEHLGCQVQREGGTICVDATTITRSDIPDELMHEMRSSVIFLGAILTRTGEARLSHPGGCELGARPIDLHLKALETMGIQVQQQGDLIVCKAANPTGCIVDLAFPSVGATENAMLAALGCQGTVTIRNAAREPEIVDLQGFLQAMGGAVFGAGTSEITVQGRPRLKPVRYRVMPDRIVAATWLCAAAATGGSVTVEGARAGDLSAVLDSLRAAGCQVETSPSGICLRAGQMLKSAGLIRTSPYPGFPTDAQAPMMAALLLSKGVTTFQENIFENRYRHVPELVKMGANISLDDRIARVTGVDALHGAEVQATDLRGGAALVIAALSAAGETYLSGLAHIDRGYEALEETLRQLGCTIKRLDIP